jgi:hypothetical protein
VGPFQQHQQLTLFVSDFVFIVLLFLLDVFILFALLFFVCGGDVPIASMRSANIVIKTQSWSIWNSRSITRS